MKVMDDKNNLRKLCKPLFIKVIRISDSDINKWKHNANHIFPIRAHSRRRLLNSWQRGDYRNSKSHQKQKLRKRLVKYVLSDSEDELSDSGTCSENNNENIYNRSEKMVKLDESVPKIRTKIIDKDITLPINNTSTNDQLVWKYKRKRSKISHPVRLAHKSENTESAIQLYENNLNISNAHHVTQVNLSKEIKIVSPRLEDSKDPQVEKWRSIKKTSLSKSKSRLTPKLNNLDCTVCSAVFDSKEELSDHIFKHTQRELQDAYKAAKTKLRGEDGNNKTHEDSIEVNKCDVNSDKINQSSTTESMSNGCKEVSHNTSIQSSTTNPNMSMRVPICSCHSEHFSDNNGNVQIEMVLFCETCHILFRRSECFETHYRFSSKCNADRTKGRVPKLFCSTCRVILNTLSNMRQHLEKHASINFHGSVTFVCNICRVVFFGVGTVFCTHWLNHEKDPTFVGSRYSFPKLCVSTQGIKPSGSTFDEQYLFVAEFVCRSCKTQFSSECELTNHIQEGCIVTEMCLEVEKKSPKSKFTASNSKTLNLTPEIVQPTIDPVPFKLLDMVNNWICEFCNECCPSRNTFEEHSLKHLQDNGYPGYCRSFQSDSSVMCILCRTVHNTFQELMNHWVTHEVIKFICTVCNEPCSSYDTFEAHISKACWKCKPSCRVWYDRQKYESMHKTTGELKGDYEFNHITQNEINVTNALPLQTLPAIRTPLESEVSSAPYSNQDNSNKIVIINPFENNNSTAPMNFIIHNSLNGLNVLPTTLDIVNSNNEKNRAPSSVEDPEILYENNSIIIPFNNNTEHEIRPELRSPKSPIINKNMNSDVPLLTKTKSTELMGTQQSTINFTMTNTGLRRSSVIISNTSRIKTSVDRTVETSNNNESDIIEIPHNLPITNAFVQKVNLHERAAMPLKSCESHTEEKTKCTSLADEIINPEPTSNIDNVSLNRFKASETIDEDPNNSGTIKPRGFLRVKKLTELQAIKNYQCDQCNATFEDSKSLENHVLDHKRPILHVQTPTMMKALILPQVHSNKEEKRSVIPITSNTPYMAGKRILPTIPQRVANADGRKANPRICELATNNSHYLPIMRSIPNVQNVDQQAGQLYYVCSLCSTFRSNNFQEFTNHLSTVHSNNSIPTINSNLYSFKMPSETSKETQKVYKCKICDYSTSDMTEIVQHEQISHRDILQQASNFEPVPQISFTLVTYDQLNSNVPRYI